ERPKAPLFLGLGNHTGRRGRSGPPALGVRRSAEAGKRRGGRPAGRKPPAGPDSGSGRLRPGARVRGPRPRRRGPPGVPAAAGVPGAAPSAFPVVPVAVAGGALALGLIIIAVRG